MAFQQTAGSASRADASESTTAAVARFDAKDFDVLPWVLDVVERIRSGSSQQELGQAVNLDPWHKVNVPLVQMEQLNAAFDRADRMIDSYPGLELTPKEKQSHYEREQRRLAVRRSQLKRYAELPALKQAGLTAPAAVDPESQTSNSTPMAVENES